MSIIHAPRHAIGGEATRVNTKSSPRRHGTSRFRALICVYPYQWATGIAATMVICAFFVIYYQAGATNAFLDGTARLNLARRVFDNIQGSPSLAQLGGVWLPLMPALEAILAWNDHLYRTGIAGSLISMASFVTLVIVVFETARTLTGRLAGGIAAAMALVLNLNVLLFGTGTMTEMLLMATIAVCGLCMTHLEATASADGDVNLRWTALTSISFMIVCLVRYDGYFITAAAVPLLICILLRRGISGHQLVAMAGTIFVMPALMIMAWLAYEGSIFGDPLYFVRSEYSARTIDVVDAGLEGPVGHPVRALGLYIGATRWSYPDILLLLALGGAGLYALRLLRSPRTPIAPLFYLLIPAFYVTALTIGEIGLDTASTYPYNVRYGLPIGVTLAVAAGYGVGTLATLPWRHLGPGLAVAAIVSLTAVSLPAWRHPVENTHILQDNGTRLPAGSAEMATWLDQHYSDGVILLEGFGWDKAYVQMESGIPLSQFLSEAAPGRWHTALAHPAAHVDWVYIGGDPDDAVGQAMMNSPEFAARYMKVYENPAGTIYRLKDEGASS